MTDVAATEQALSDEATTWRCCPDLCPSPAVLAAITAAVELVWPEPGPPDEQDPVHQTWRFSGRWWNKPTPLRRDRPWARR